ncbi:ATP-binding protein, partial [Bradyrhizobium sp.]|uniref:ATP-binding protein n=1 Tax=Bradyrhizobium sp. TaxID=376 RepID=UPI003C520E31
MLRLTLAARLALIVTVGFSVVVIVVVGVFYLTTLRETELTRPSPARLAALAGLLEQTRPDQRERVLEAVSSPQFVVRIEPSGTSSGGADAASPPRSAHDASTGLLAGRAIEIVAVPDRALGRWFPRLAKLMEATEFRITLRDGEILVVDARTRLPVTPLGLPVGFGAGLFGTIVALLALLVMQRETRPLARLAAAVDRVGLSVDPPLLPQARRSAPEIRAVIAAFNRLQGRLSEMLRARMTLIGGIAHDVRTFATRLRLRVEQIPDAAERERSIADIDDMIRLLDDALLSARTGGGGLAQEMVELAALVCADVGDRQAQGDVVDVTTEPGARDAIVLGDRLALRRVLANVIDNAIKYGRVAHVRTSVQQQMIAVSVEDEGPGIPEEARAAM